VPPAPVTNAPPAVARESITLDGRTFSLELANTPAGRQRGLMYRETIDPEGGMLFVFPYISVRAFWMGWCLTDLDIIFVGPSGRVTATHQMKEEPPQQPGETEQAYRDRLPDYSSRMPAQFAIELAGGTLDSIEVAFGDQLDMDWVRLAREAR
jgi:uncharacterized membrane protein (UPF0127 family)